jgi:hypothetical protein
MIKVFVVRGRMKIEHVGLRISTVWNCAWLLEQESLNCLMMLLTFSKRFRSEKMAEFFVCEMTKKVV